METEKINPIYVHVDKKDGDSCGASEWNALSEAVSETQAVVNSLIDDVGNMPEGGGGVTSIFDCIVLEGNRPFVSQVTKANKIYIIQDNFDLQGEVVHLPDNVSLRFEHGSVANGSVVLSNTRIEGVPSFADVTISGSCANEVLTPQMFGAVPSPVETEDNKDAHTLGFENLARVVDNNGTLSKVIHLSAGHYAVCRKITIMSGCKFYGDGGVTVIDLYDGSGGLAFGNASSCCSLIAGCTLTTDASKGDDTITVTDTADIENGDYLIITDVVDGSFDKSRIYYRMSEVVRVLAKQDNTLRLNSDLYGTYPAEFGEGDTTTMGDAPGYRVAILHFRPKKYSLSAFKIISHRHSNQVQTHYALAVNGHVDSLMEEVTIENYGNNVAATFFLGKSFSITRCRIRNYVTNVDDSYGLAISHGQDFSVSECTLRANWHALATGGGGSIYGIVNRNFTYRRLQFERFSEGAHNKDDIDVHANAEYYRYEDIDAPHVSCDTGGKNVTVENCRLYKIGTSFHGAGLTIRNCEIFSTDTASLVYYNDDGIDYSDYSLIIEGTKFHGFVHYNLQGGKKELFDFVFRNNICGGLLLREGKIQKVLFSNNIITRRGLDVRNIDAKEVLITNNIFNDGCVIVNPPAGSFCNGVISGNILRYNGSEREVDSVFFIGRFRGMVCDNNAVNVADNVMVSLTNGAVVNMYDNTFKQGAAMTQKPIVSVSNGASLVFNRNTHNSLRSNSSLISGSKGNAKSDKNMSIGDMPPIPSRSIGETIYFQDQNKMGYTSCGIGSTRLELWTVGKTNPVIVSNTLEYGKAYFATFRAGSTNLYFSKASTTDENNTWKAISDKEIMGSAVFNAPDPSEYPYIVIRSSVDDNNVEIYENRSVSEYDGAEINVKRSGTKGERPEGRKIYIGFTYFDTTIMKPIYAAAIAIDSTVTWVDAVGMSV